MWSFDKFAQYNSEKQPCDFQQTSREKKKKNPAIKNLWKEVPCDKNPCI